VFRQAAKQSGCPFVFPAFVFPANLYSLIETCKANRIDPYGHLVSLFCKLPTAQSADDFEALLPWRLANPTP
jgi:hypothetical protein